MANLAQVACFLALPFCSDALLCFSTYALCSLQSSEEREADSSTHPPTSAAG